MAGKRWAPGKPIYSPEQWAEAKSRYAAGDKVVTISNDTGIPRKTISCFAKRQQWPRTNRTYHRPNPKGFPTVVTRRCVDCAGHFTTTPGGYEHMDCPRARKVA